MEIIHKLHEDGHTVIMVTHDPGIAANANRVIEIRDGQIISIRQKILIFRPAKWERIKEKASLVVLLRSIYGSIQNVGTGDYGAQNVFAADHAGIIIGIASVVSVVALGNGSQQKNPGRHQLMGTNTISIFLDAVLATVEADESRH